MPGKQPEELSDRELEALGLLKDNIKEWLGNQLKEGQTLSHDHTLIGIQEAVFEQFEGEESIDSNKQRPLLLRALKEVIAEYNE